MVTPIGPSEGQKKEAGFESKYQKEQLAVHGDLDALRQKSTDQGVKKEAQDGKYNSLESYMGTEKAKEFKEKHPQMASMAESFIGVAKKATEGVETVRQILGAMFSSSFLEKIGEMFGGWLKALAFEVAKKGVPMFKDLLSDKSIVYKPKNLPSNFDALTAEEKTKIMEAESKKEMNGAAPKLESLYARMNLKPHPGMPPSAFMQLVATVIREGTDIDFSSLPKDTEDKRIFNADTALKAAEKVLANENAEIAKKQQQAKSTAPASPSAPSGGPAGKPAEAGAAPEADPFAKAMNFLEGGKTFTLNGTPYVVEVPARGETGEMLVNGRRWKIRAKEVTMPLLKKLPLIDKIIKGLDFRIVEARWDPAKQQLVMKVQAKNPLINTAIGVQAGVYTKEESVQFLSDLNTQSNIKLIGPDNKYTGADLDLQPSTPVPPTKLPS